MTPRRRRGRLGERLHTALVAAVLLTAGVLLGSFWLEWRGPLEEPAGSVASPAETLPVEARPRVEVLNGAGEPGIARRFAEHLRERGFDVVHYGNAAHFGHPRTVVVGRTERPEVARQVAAELGADSVTSEPRPELRLDATVLLGADWRGLVGLDGRTGGEGAAKAAEGGG